MKNPETAAPAAFVVSPFCRNLCSKKLVFRTSPPRSEGDVLDAACNTWCSRTMDGVGPDGEVTGTEWCRSDRDCFESYGPQA